MTKEEKSEIKYRMKRLARKFCRRNDVYRSFDDSVGALVEKSYLSAYLLCLHENKNKIEVLEKEVAKLKDDLCRVTDARDGFRTVMLSYEHKIKGLEEQLGNRQMQSRKETSDFVWKLKTANEQKTEQLIKAKEIIKALLKLWNDVMTEEIVKALIAEAEQFLKEIE